MKNHTHTHTPGPWHINTLEVVSVTIHASRGHVATISDGSMHEVGADEREANARLIAAAPELIEACKAVEEVFRAAPILETDWKLPGSYAAWKACVNAIARAEGK